MTEHQVHALSEVADAIEALQSRLDGIADDLAALRARLGG